MSNSFRVLVIEDNSQLATTLRTMIRQAVDEVEVVRAPNGLDAWDSLKLETFDLVVSGWNLPQMSGGDLLLSVRSHFKTRNLPFIMLTTRSDRVSVMYAIRSGVTAYITKPFDRGAFIERVESLLSQRRQELAEAAHEGGEEGYQSQEALRQRAVEEVVKRIQVGHVDLPVLPEVAEKLSGVVNRPEARIPDVAELIKPDASLSSKLIGIANSAYYRGSRPFTTLEEAITRLGFNQVRNYVTVVTTRGLFDSDEPYFGALLRRLWLHCVATAAAARSIAQHLRTRDQDVLYSKGLLHDIGKLMLLHTIAKMPQRRLDDKAIDKILRNMHTEYGAALLKHWHYPCDFQDTCLHHHDVGDSHEWAPELLVVNLANRLVRRLGWSLHTDDQPEEAEEAAENEIAQVLGLDSGMIDAVLDEVVEYVNEIQIMVWGAVEEFAGNGQGQKQKAGQDATPAGENSDGAA